MFRKKPEIKSNLNKFKHKEPSTIYIVDYDSGEKKKMITSFYGQSNNHFENYLETKSTVKK